MLKAVLSNLVTVSVGIRDASGILLAVGSLVNRLYHLDCEDALMGRHEGSVALSGEANLCHQRLSRVHEKSLQKFINQIYVDWTDVKKIPGLSFCEECTVWKCTANVSLQWEKFVQG